jgi:hypothetical protein
MEAIATLTPSSRIVYAVALLWRFHVVGAKLVGVTDVEPTAEDDAAAVPGQ